MCVPGLQQPEAAKQPAEGRPARCAFGRAFLFNEYRWGRYNESRKGKNGLVGCGI